jgi:hypothetical protein
MRHLVKTENFTSVNIATRLLVDTERSALARAFQRWSDELQSPRKGSNVTTKVSAAMVVGALFW